MQGQGFRMPSGARKPPMQEPAGPRRWSMGTTSFVRLRRWRNRLNAGVGEDLVREILARRTRDRELATDDVQFCRADLGEGLDPTNLGSVAKSTFYRDYGIISYSLISFSCFESRWKWNSATQPPGDGSGRLMMVGRRPRCPPVSNGRAGSAVATGGADNVLPRNWYRLRHRSPTRPFANGDIAEHVSMQGEENHLPLLLKHELVRGLDHTV